MRLAVHVTPRAGKDEVAGWRGDELEVRVTAPPDGGKANEAACKLVAGLLGVPKSAVRVARGQTARHKSLEIEADEARVRAVFGEPSPGLF